MCARYSPWPSAYTTWQGQRLKLLRACAAATVLGHAVTEIGRVIGGADAAGVMTGDGVLWLEEAQLAGKRPLPIGAFLRGAAGFVGSRLGDAWHGQRP